MRRLYIPKNLQKEVLEWLEADGMSSGYIFLNRFGKRITTRGISTQLKQYGVKYGIPQRGHLSSLFPSSFRNELPCMIQRYCSPC